VVAAGDAVLDHPSLPVPAEALVQAAERCWSRFCIHRHLTAGVNRTAEAVREIEAPDPRPREAVKPLVKDPRRRRSGTRRPPDTPRTTPRRIKSKPANALHTCGAVQIDQQSRARKTRCASPA